MNQIGQIYPPGPYDYTRELDWRVDFTTDRDAAAALIPEALQPDPDGRAWIRSTHHRTSTFGPYRAAYIGLYAEFDGRPIRYMVNGLKTDFMGTVAGREIWGLPFTLGQVEAGWSGNVFTSAIRGASGEELAHVRLHTAHRQTTPFPALGACYVSELRDHCGNVLKTQLLNAENEYVPSEVDTWEARASVRLLPGSVMNDWSRIPVKEVLRAEYRTGGKNSLPMATVLAEW